MKLNRNKTLKIIAVIIGAMIILLAGIISIIKFAIPQSQYGKANNLMNEGKYSEAITIFEKIKTYKDSEDKIFDCNIKIRDQKEKELSKYLGTYDKTEMSIDPVNGDEVPYGYVLEITSAGSAGIEFTLTNYGHRIASTSATAKLKGDKYKFLYHDSWENYGEGILELLKDGVKITIGTNKYDEMANYDMGETEIEFKFADRTSGM